MENKEIYIVAGGSSLKNFDFTKLQNKTTIVSNKSIFDIPTSKYFITTDYTFLNYIKSHKTYKLWKNHPAKKIFVINYIAPHIQFFGDEIIDTKYNLKYNLKDFNQVIICKSAKGIGFDFDHFNSGYNSGFCSFQYALIMGFNPIYLLGMDMCSTIKTHYHNGYGRSYNKFNQNLKHYHLHFSKVLQKLRKEYPDIKIISCSKISKLNEFIEYKNIEKVL